MCNLPHPSLPPSLPPSPPSLADLPPCVLVVRYLQDHIYPSIICHFSPPQRFKIEIWRGRKSRPGSSTDNTHRVRFSRKHKTARKISLRFTFFKPGKKVHLAALILKVRAWDQFARLNVNGMKIVFLFKLFLKIKVWQQLARSRFPLHCLFVLEFIFSCNLRLESEWDPSPLTTIWQVCDGECPGDQQFILLRESPSLLN